MDVTSTPDWSGIEGRGYEGNKERRGGERWRQRWG